MSSGLDPSAQKLVQLAKLAERDLKRDKRLVQRKIMLAVAAGAAASKLLETQTAEGAALAAERSHDFSSAPGSEALTSKAITSQATSSVALKLLAVVASVAAIGIGVYGASDDKSVSTKPPALLETSAKPAPPVAPVAPPANTSAAGEPKTPEAQPLRATQHQSINEGVKPESVVTPPSSTRTQQRVTAPIKEARVAAREREMSDPKREVSAPVDAKPAKPTKPPSTLSSDLSLLQEAQKALNRGAPARALSILEDMQGRELLAEQSAIEVFALCALGQVERAREKARLFRRIAKGSPLMPRVDASCAKPE
jgi:hypothetical protein